MQTAHCAAWRLVLGSVLLGYSPLDARPDLFEESWRWVQFTTESGLPSDNIYDVLETPDGTLWAVSDAGVAWYDGYQWLPVRLPGPQFMIRTRPPSDYRRDSILVALDNGEWYAVGREGFRKLPLPLNIRLTYLSGDTVLCLDNSSLYLFTGGRLESCKMPERFINLESPDLLRTKGGGVWLTSSSGLFRWEDGRWCPVFISDEQMPKMSFRIADDPRVATFASFELPLNLRGLWEYSAGSARRLQTSPVDVQAITVSPSRMLVVATYSGDVLVRTSQAWSSSPALRTKCKGLNNFHFRRNGDLVIASIEGIQYFTASSRRWRLLPAGSGLGAVNEILSSSSGDIWVGSANGLVVYDTMGTPTILTRIGDVPLITITGLGEDRDGNIWVSSGGAFDGAYRWDGSAWKYFRISNNRDGARFHKIRPDRSGRLWFLGLSRFGQGAGPIEPGVFVYDGKQFAPWAREHDLPNTKVYDFCEDSAGGLWFATHDGILRWRQGIWRRWTVEEGLPSNHVFTLGIDRRRNVWFGFQENVGLGCIDTTGAVTIHTTTGALANDRVWDVSVDSEGILWIATRAGLVSYGNGIWSRFDESSGLQSNLLWPVLPLEEEVLVGTHGNGVAILNRKESIIPKPRIVIDRPNIDGRDVRLRWRAYAFQGTISPSEILTQYRLDDEAWSAWSKARELELSEVPAGEHSISLQARGPFGRTTPVIQQATFTVLPPLPLRPVVFLPAGALVAALVALASVLIARKRQYNADLRQREAKFRAVTELTSSAIFIYDSLGIHFMNSSAESITGRRLRETGMISLTDLIVPDDRDNFRRQCLRSGGPGQERSRCEIRIDVSGAGIRWLDFTAGPIEYLGKEMVLGTAFDITERKAAEGKLRSLTTELVSTEERERRRVAVYLHDVIGQSLALCKIKLRTMQKAAPAAGSDEDLTEVLRLVNELIKDTRTLTFDLSPPVLYDLDFPAALRSLTEQLVEPHSLKLEFICDGYSGPAKDEVKVIVYHVVRELIMNTIKHARAGRITVDLSVRGGSMFITVADDGIGFDPVRGLTAGSADGGFGLFNIRERLTHLGGSLVIHTGTGEGTRATITIPLTTSAENT